MGEAEERLVEFIRETQTELPGDVAAALRAAYDVAEGDVEKKVLKTILGNAQKSREYKTPICQDTGNLLFYVNRPARVSEGKIKERIFSAVELATKKIPLRGNVVGYGGESKEGNVGLGLPAIEFTETKGDCVEVTLFCKGGGSENASYLYRLPDLELKAERNLEGVRRCVLDSALKTQGRACSPNVIGVGVSGLADKALALSKKQLLRNLDDMNTEDSFSGFEQKILKEVNSLGMGPMGLGGRTTALAVKIGFEDRHPASFFVAVVFGCWALRRNKKEFECDLF
ncbi:MAG: fumarate hydratase [Candidatus Altiarchaeales archaeon]|nr:fumarate hydratase [Candidatus Altiarchaeales archaeon]